LLARIEVLCRQGDQDALADQIPNAHALAAQTLAAVEIFQIRLAANAEKVQLQPD
jgi:hypothetical protein